VNSSNVRLLFLCPLPEKRERRRGSEDLQSPSGRENVILSVAKDLVDTWILQENYKVTQQVILNAAKNLLDISQVSTCQRDPSLRSG